MIGFTDAYEYAKFLAKDFKVVMKTLRKEGLGKKLAKISLAFHAPKHLGVGAHSLFQSLPGRDPQTLH